MNGINIWTRLSFDRQRRWDQWSSPCFFNPKSALTRRNTVTIEHVPHGSMSKFTTRWPAHALTSWGSNQRQWRVSPRFVRENVKSKMEILGINYGYIYSYNEVPVVCLNAAGFMMILKMFATELLFVTGCLTWSDKSWPKWSKLYSSWGGTDRGGVCQL